MAKTITWYCCDWWNHHSFAAGIWSKCECYSYFGPAFRMKDWLESMGYKVTYPQDITQTMRDQYIIGSPYKPEIPFLKCDHPLTTSEVSQRNAWTIARLQVTSVEELQELKQKVIDMYPKAYSTGRLRPNVLKALTYILLRRRYNCPHP